MLLWINALVIWDCVKLFWAAKKFFTVWLRMFVTSTLIWQEFQVFVRSSVIVSCVLEYHGFTFSYIHYFWCISLHAHRNWNRYHNLVIPATLFLLIFSSLQRGSHVYLITGSTPRFGLLCQVSDIWSVALISLFSWTFSFTVSSELCLSRKQVILLFSFVRSSVLGIEHKKKHFQMALLDQPGV